MASMNVRSGDTVEIIVGGVEDYGKRGRVIVANPEEGTVTVENLNMVTKHQKPRSAQEQGGKIERPRAIDVSNVMVVCPKCGNKTRVGHVLGENGKYFRVCKHKNADGTICGASLDAKAEKKAAKSAKKSAAKKKSATKE